MKITYATPEDAGELLEIYAPYVTDTAITFEYTVPTVEEFRERIVKISSKYPYLKAVDDRGNILGYAYATEFKGRKAYDWSVETTIYLRGDQKRNGVGRALYNELERVLREIGILNMNACIALAKVEDEHLTNGSMYFHEKMGYELVATFHASGYKFNTWYDMIWMEKMLGEHTAEVAPVRFGEWKQYIISTNH